MTMTTRAGGRSLLPDVFNLLEATTWPFTGRHPVHIEEFVDGQTYVVRAELPGLDPERDIEVQASEGYLTIRAERQQTERDQQRSEFRYGLFERSVALPGGADTEAVEASYGKGILEVRVPMRKSAQEHRVQITSASESEGQSRQEGKSKRKKS